MTGQNGAGSLDLAALAAAITGELDGRGAKRHGRELRFHCPAPEHDDEHPSASWSEAKRTWCCRSLGCHKDRTRARDLALLLGMDPERYRQPAAANGRAGVTTRHHDYRDAAGAPVLRVTITRQPNGDKTVYQSVRGPGGWTKGGGEWPEGRPLYRLPELLAIGPEAPVYYTEGEKDADTLAAAGLVATTSCMGAGSAKHTDLRPLAGRAVNIMPDHDVPGFAHARDVAGRALEAGAAVVRIVPLPGEAAEGQLPGEHGRDVTDWLAGGGTVAALLAAADAAPAFVPGPAPEVDPDTGEVPALDVPPYPLEALPELVRSYVQHSAAAIGCPPEMVAVPLLVNAGAALGRRKALRLKAGFEELPILWGAVVVKPGGAKSPAQRAATRPLYVLQSEAQARYDRELADFENALAGWKATPKDQRGALPPEPVLEHFWTADTTIEQLAHIVQGSAGVALVRDELVGWVCSFDAYKKGGDRQASLTAWSGNPLKVDRRNRDACAYAERPVICVAGGVQPDMLSALSDDAGRDDGFIQRFLWAMPTVRPARWTTVEVPEAVTAELCAIFRDLRTGPTSAEPVTLTPGAMRVWVAWFNEAADVAEESSGLAAGVASKLPNQAARLALVLHALADPKDLDRPLSAETMGAAIELAEYHRAHAALVLARMGAEGKAARPRLETRVLRVIDRAGAAGATRSDLLRATRAATADLDVALASLEGQGIAYRVTGQPGPKGGRPVEFWKRTGEVTEVTEESRGGGEAVSSDSSVTSDSAIPSSPVPNGAVPGALDPGEPPGYVDVVVP